MKRVILAGLAGLLAGGIIAVSHAKLPAAAPKSDAEKKAEADKAAAAKAKDAELLGKAQDRAVANYKNKKKGASMAPSKPKK